MRPAPPLLLAGLATTVLRGAGSVGVMGVDEGAGAPSPEAAATPGGGGSVQRHDRCVIGAGPAGLCAPHTPPDSPLGRFPGRLEPAHGGAGQARAPRAAAPPAKRPQLSREPPLTSKALFGRRQLGFFFEQSRRDYIILEQAAGPGSYFRKYPRHRQLISINKRNTGHGPPPASPQSAREWRRENRCAFLLPAFLPGVFASAGGYRP